MSVVIKLLLVLVSVGCGSRYQENVSRNYLPPSEDTMKQLINGDLSSGLESARTIYNKDYPIYLRLLADGSFHFSIPGHDSGFGQWQNHDQGVTLTAAAKYGYTMSFDLRAEDQSGKGLRLIFQDRFKLRNLALNRSNITVP